MDKIYTTFGLLLATLILTGCAQSSNSTLPYKPAQPSNNVAGYASAIQEDAATPINSFTVEPESAEIGADKGQMFTISIEDLAIYNTGYYTTDGGENWKPFTLTDGNTIQGYVLNDASTEVSITGDELQEGVDEYVILYSCSWNDGWDCHGNWQAYKLDLSKKPQCTGDQCLVDGECVANQTVQNEEICINGKMRSLEGIGPDGPPGS